MGCDYSIYNQNQSAYNSTIIKTVKKTLDVVQQLTFLHFHVYSYTSAATSRKRRMVDSLVTSGLSVYYEILITDSHYSITSIKSILSTSIDNGDFIRDMNQFAAFYHASGLLLSNNISVTSLVVVDLTPSNIPTVIPTNLKNVVIVNNSSFNLVYLIILVVLASLLIIFIILFCFPKHVDRFKSYVVSSTITNKAVDPIKVNSSKKSVNVVLKTEGDAKMKDLPEVIDDFDRLPSAGIGSAVESSLVFRGTTNSDIFSLDPSNSPKTDNNHVMELYPYSKQSPQKSYAKVVPIESIVCVDSQSSKRALHSVDNPESLTVVKGFDEQDLNKRSKKPVRMNTSLYSNRSLLQSLPVTGPSLELIHHQRQSKSLILVYPMDSNDKFNSMA